MLKEKTQSKPAFLFQKLYRYHIARVINAEDLGRVILRKEIMFYHTVLEDALDHFLQALFAANSAYFPSRKRSEAFIETFDRKTKDCYMRLVQILEKSVSQSTIEESVEELKKITVELSGL